MEWKDHLQHKNPFPNCFSIPNVDYTWLTSTYNWCLRQHYKLYKSFDIFVSAYTDGDSLIVEGPGIIIRFCCFRFSFV